MEHDLTVLERALISGLIIADETWRRVHTLIDDRVTPFSPTTFLARLREIFELYEPIWAKTLTDAVLAAWIEAHLKTIHKAGLTLPPSGAPGGSFGPPIGPPEILRFHDPDEPPPVVRFPKIDEGANALASRRIVLPGDYYAMEGRARQLAFTVSKIGTEDTIEKVRDLLVRDVETGGTLAGFRRAVAKVKGASALSPAHVETVYRTNVLGAYAAGQLKILQHPLVRTEFPYVLYSATHDSRTRPNHRALEFAGIQGTGVYRMDDPVIREFWAPWDFSCRCKMILLTLEMAAERYSIREAQEWLRTGQPPQFPAFVPHPGFSAPAGWTRVFELPTMAA